LPPKCNSAKDWAIRRDSAKDINVRSKALNDYQRATQAVDGIVYSPNKYRETEGIKEQLPNWRLTPEAKE
jgi:hypothetical protein